MVLPASYVRDWVALGYAATVHSSQGLTVDSSHLVATQNTSVYALYVAMTRGRVANTAHVVTQSLAKEAEYGETTAAAKRSPLSVLRGAFDLDDPQLSALQAAAESAAEADRLRTPAELLADGIALATAGRTARWLDELTDAGVLTADQRTALAVEDGAGTLADPAAPGRAGRARPAPGADRGDPAALAARRPPDQPRHPGPHQAHRRQPRPGRRHLRRPAPAGR